MQQSHFIDEVTGEIYQFHQDPNGGNPVPPLVQYLFDNSAKVMIPQREN